MSARHRPSHDAYQYLSVDEALALYEQAMERTGQAPEGLRNPGGLESALARARQAGVYLDADMVHQAAVLAAGISQNQPFHDGNKRAAFAVLSVFLRLNGYRFVPDPADRYAIVDRLAALAVDVGERGIRYEEAEAAFEGWLRAHVAPL